MSTNRGLPLILPKNFNALQKMEDIHARVRRWGQWQVQHIYTFQMIPNFDTILAAIISYKMASGNQAIASCVT